MAAGRDVLLQPEAMRMLVHRAFKYVLATALVVTTLATTQTRLRANDPAAAIARSYAQAVKQVNERHARASKKNTESDLAKKFPKGARRALAKLLKAPAKPSVGTALVQCGEAALDLDLIDDFKKIRERLKEDFPEKAAELGAALSRPRVLLRGLGGLDEAYLENFAEVVETVLAAYDELFGFAEWSKVPGKKLRIRVHLEEKIKRPPHFAPQFPFHSEIDFPVMDPKRLASPTSDGKFLFYGVCHELGHVIAMWGDRKTEEDHHAWAHYTGVVLVEELSQKKYADKKALQPLRDVRWRSLKKLREETAEKKPSLENRDGVLSLLVKLHDLVGPGAMGAAINELDKKKRNLRINKVRYYRFADFQGALFRAVKSKKNRIEVKKLFAQL